jgi:hypothetical protein
MQGFGQNLAVHFVCVFVVEGWQACEHFVEQDAESPPVNSFGVATAGEEFRGEVLRGTAEGWSLLASVLWLRWLQCKLTVCPVFVFHV